MLVTIGPLALVVVVACISFGVARRARPEFVEAVGVAGWCLGASLLSCAGHQAAQADVALALMAAPALGTALRWLAPVVLRQRRG